MKIFKTDSVKDVQARFNDRYPFLKLEFYQNAHALFAGSKASDQIAPETMIVDLNPDFVELNIPVLDEMSVNALEAMIEDSCKLHVQVFRKSGKTWLQTSSTDHWSLQKHMDRAEETEHFYQEK